MGELSEKGSKYRVWYEEKEALEKKAKKLCSQEFACIPDAQVALNQLIKEVEKKGFEIHAEIVEKTNKKYLCPHCLCQKPYYL